MNEYSTFDDFPDEIKEHSFEVKDELLRRFQGLVVPEMAKRISVIAGALHVVYDIAEIDINDSSANKVFANLLRQVCSAVLNNGIDIMEPQCTCCREGGWNEWMADDDDTVCDSMDLPRQRFTL